METEGWMSDLGEGQRSAGMDCGIGSIARENRGDRHRIIVLNKCSNVKR